MPRYIIERDVPDIADADLGAVAAKSMAVIAQMEGLVWIKSYVSHVDGKIYCEYDAPNPEALREHARRAGLPCNHISEIALEINPDMFQ